MVGTLCQRNYIVLDLQVISFFFPPLASYVSSASGRILSFDMAYIVLGKCAPIQVLDPNTLEL